MPAPEKKILESAEVPDWGDFQVAMLRNQAYYSISQLSADRAAVRRLETFFSVKGEKLEVAITFWKAMIDGLPEDERPNAFEAGQWRAIAEATHMPISFDDDGYLTVNDES